MPRKRKLPPGMRQRGKVYHADFCLNGRRIRKRLSTNLDVACELLRDLQAKADKEDFGIFDNDYAIASLKEDYLRHCRQTQKPSTVSRFETCMKQILPRIGAARVCQVQIRNVLQYREERLAEGASPRTVNYEVSALSTMFRWAINQDPPLIKNNPLERLKRLRHDHPKEGRALDTEEVNRVLAASPAHWRDIWYTLLVTGMRKEEVASLTFRNIDWQAREIIVVGSVSKNHKERRIPIDAGLWEILQRKLEERDNRQPGIGTTSQLTQKVKARFTREHVFTTTQNTPLTHRSGLYQAFMRCCALAKIETRTLDLAGREIEHVDLHSLRRTFATSLIANGADPKSVQELLGHATLDMTMKIYTKIHGQTKRQAVAKLPYGQGTLAPEGVLDYTDSKSIPVQKCHESVTSDKREAAG